MNIDLCHRLRRFHRLKYSYFELISLIKILEVVRYLRESVKSVAKRINLAECL